MRPVIDDLKCCGILNFLIELLKVQIYVYIVIKN